MNKLSKQKDENITKLMWLGLQSSFIFAIPAFAGIFVGQKIDALYNSGVKATIAVLACAFILSWALFFILYIRITKKIKANKNV